MSRNGFHSVANYEEQMVFLNQSMNLPRGNPKDLSNFGNG
jgi:hypothetical protein